MEIKYECEEKIRIDKYLKETLGAHILFLFVLQFIKHFFY